MEMRRKEAFSLSVVPGNETAKQLDWWHSPQLRLPLVCRGFAYAVLSISLMWCLECIMSFQHFFQALSLFNVLHMLIGGLVGSEPDFR